MNHTILRNLLLAGTVLAASMNLPAATHVVVKGDTLTRIARRAGCTVAELKEVNGLTSDVIVLGRTLRLPDSAATPEDTQTTRITVNAKQKPALVHRDVLAGSTGRNTRVVVDLSRQRAYLLVAGEVAIDSPVSTGKPGHATPRGTFAISERVQSGKVSNRYHSLMPYWMRLGKTAVGLHIGKLPGTPASHGCIRLPRQIAPLVFAHTTAGTEVSVVEQWTRAAVPAPTLAVR